MAVQTFFTKLQPFSDFASASEPSFYVDAPDDWWIGISDVQGSTQAIKAGRYRVVNAASVACLTAVLNTLGSTKAYPFAFGGDGATFLFPPERVDEIRATLASVSAMVRNQFNLNLRTGVVALSDLRAQGHDVRVARFELSAGVSIACLAGTGIAEADALLKSNAIENIAPSEALTVSYEGFLCRWSPIPSVRGQMIALLVQARAGSSDDQSQSYQRILAGLTQVLRSWQAVAPTSQERLRYGGFEEGKRREAPIQTYRKPSLLKLLTQIGIFLSSTAMKFAFLLNLPMGPFSPKRYRGQMVQNSDTKKFDGGIKVIIDVTEEELAELRSLLESFRESGECFYGIHQTSEAIVTCMVHNPMAEDGHVHFIDAHHGGYAMAAAELKSQMKEGAGAP